MFKIIFVDIVKPLNIPLLVHENTRRQLTNT